MNKKTIITALLAIEKQKRGAAMQQLPALFCVRFAKK
jgi:hypothetical protein